MRLLKRITIILISTIIFTSAGTPLKRVLVIGDSISMGYTKSLSALLKERAIVVRNEGNAYDTRNGLKCIEKWLGDTEWDVIHFNFGLHDLCYRTSLERVSSNRDKINGKIAITLEEYESNLEGIVNILKKTGAELIFATTTMVPKNELGRISSDVDIYNRVATEVMKNNGIKINDLYKHSLKIHHKYGGGENDVHYKKEGYSLLAKKVEKAIKSKL